MKTPRPLNVNNLIHILQNSVKKGTIKLTDTIYLASDEEGNTYSPLTLQSITIEDTGRLNLYPLHPIYE